MIHAVIIDGFESAELVRVLEAFVAANGQPLEVSVGELSRAASAACLVVVRDLTRSQLAAARDVLQVDDEAELPLQVATRVGAGANLEVALRFYLQQRQNIELSSITSTSAESIAFRGSAWRAVEGPELAELSGVLVALPVAGCVTLRADGGVATVTASEPAADDVNEARMFVASLVQHGQVHTHMPGQRARGSHEVVTDREGQRRLVRLRTGSR